MTERELQAAVVELAGLLGWRHYHTLDSRGSVAGFPDLVLVRVRTADRFRSYDPRLIFAELKGDRGRLSDEQREWLHDLGEIMAATAIRGVDEAVVTACLWTPAEWASGEIERALRAEP